MKTTAASVLAALLYFDAAAFLGAWMGLAKGWDVPLPAADLLGPQPRNSLTKLFALSNPQKSR